MFKVGIVLNFYTKTSVALVELDGTLAVGDFIRFVRNGETVFEQKVESIQIGYTKANSATRGSVVGLKTNEEVEKEDQVFKI